MSVEQAKEAPEMTAKIDEEQSAGEPMKEIAKIEQLKIIEQDEDGISVPNWLVEVMEWIERMEMVESKISTSCQAFKQLCWPKLHGNVEPYFVDLYLDKERDQSGNLRSVVRHLFRRNAPVLPIPQVPPPDYILGFNKIKICFMDDRTTEFIKLIAPKINDIEIRVLGDTARDEWIKTIEGLLNIFGNKITKLHFISPYKIEDFNLLFPGIFNQIKKLNVNLSAEWTRDQDFDFLYDWLMNERQTDGQKILNFFLHQNQYASFVERIKEAFLNDTVRRNFIVCFESRQLPNEFIEENEKTGEILHFYRNPELENFDHFCHLLIRCPKEEEDRWKKEGTKKLRGEYDDTTEIQVGDEWH